MPGFGFRGALKPTARMWLSVLGSGVCYGGGSRVLSPLEISGVIAGAWAGGGGGWLFAVCCVFVVVVEVVGLA